tara:strand:- start:25 stop:279 length:255 start_codon:yes stop_codon:yes gene_type:complete
MKLENCETEADFFGWYYKECKKSNYDLHWKDAMELEVPAQYAYDIQHAVAYHVYEAWTEDTDSPDTKIVGTEGYYGNIPDGYCV